MKVMYFVLRPISLCYQHSTATLLTYSFCLFSMLCMIIGILIVDLSTPNDIKAQCRWWLFNSICNCHCWFK